MKRSNVVLRWLILCLSLIACSEHPNQDFDAGVGDDDFDAAVEIQGTSQALLGDMDGDGVADAVDNCPSMANASQTNSNGFGGGDACELKFVFSDGLLNQYIAFQSHRTLIANLGPLTLGLGPDLMRIWAPAPFLAVANGTLLTNRLGVLTPLELLPGYVDTIGGSEVLSIEVGKDGVLGAAKATEVWLRLDGTAQVQVKFFDGQTQVGTQTASNSGTHRVRFAAGGALFDRIDIRTTSGRVGLKGKGEIITFTLGSGVLPCPTGYERVNAQCVDINECAGLNHLCDSLTTCTNTEGSYSCGACPSGYSGTGATSCVDIDECATGAATCSTLVTCSNSAGSYQCGSCPAGYRGDGHTCTDIDECEESLDTCDPLVTCSSTPGSYICGACPAGYSGGGQTGCVDIDECTGPERACDSRVTCTNLPGSFSCGACPSGYRGNGATGCVDVDECLEGLATCSTLVTCANTDGSYQCGACPQGYTGDGHSCVDVDECALGLDRCSDLVDCANTSGSYTCGDCPDGYAGDGETCTDIDECLSEPCDPRTQCQNTLGSYLCSACPSGFTGNGHTGCVDIDECGLGIDDCSALVTCGNTLGGYQCAPCPSGYAGDGRTCIDIDECATGADSCSDLVVCANTEGSYSCGACPQGYAGNGHTCTDVDECLSHPCDPLTDCSNSPGSYTCTACPAGYSGDGYAGCVDIDECAVSFGGCPETEGCLNTIGSHQCVACQAGSVGVATQCGVGACANTGITTCVRGVVHDSCIEGTPAAQDITCQGIDDDCDGTVDEDYPDTATSCGVGACASTGVESCSAGHVIDSCTPAGASSDANCDGVDDDCDGVADDDFVTVSISCGVGTCVRSGSRVCTNGAQHDDCTPGSAASSDTTCDQIDEDCDGTADDEFVSSPTSCGVGACASSGQLSCVDGVVANSCLPGQPAANDDSCNGVDDDCDGASDEDFVSTEYTCGIGACTAVGRNACPGGQLVSQCQPGLPAASDASCNGVDDDCDGASDEDAVSFAQTCGVGACVNTVQRTCVGGTWSGTCAPLSPVSAVDTTCDGVDDDCDGAVDEDFVPVEVSCGAGACVNIGVTSCVAGVVVNSCVPWPALAAVDDACDGIDADCDGLVDEDYLTQTTTCGVGQCARTGTEACVFGAVVNTCSAGSAGTSDTTCNGVDEDCDGQVDEDYSGTCDGTTAQVCVNGQLVNQADCSDNNVCTGIESCAEGRCVRQPTVIDDGNPCTTDSCDPIAGVSHTDLPFGSSCSDGDACNGIELCVPCLESQNLLVNGSFESVPMEGLNGQGYLPTDWWAIWSTADTYTFDGSWGLHRDEYGNFSNVRGVPDGARWVAGWSIIAPAEFGPESFAQELREPLVTGQRYRIRAKLHQSGRVDLSSPGGYELYLSSRYENSRNRQADTYLGRIGTTSPMTDWVDVKLEFTAPANIADKVLLVFVPYAERTEIHSYPGLDAVSLVSACAETGAFSCQRQGAPVLDDKNVCTLDSCSAQGGVAHQPLPQGTTCNGSGQCNATGACSNRPPVFTNSPPPYHIFGSGNYTHQVTVADPDGDPVTFRRVTGSTGSWTITSAGLLRFLNPDRGLYIVRIEASDARGGVSEQRKLFQVLNGEIPVPMVVSAPEQHAVLVNTLFSYQARVWTQNPNAQASFVFEDAPPLGMTVSPSGAIRWTPAQADVGTHQISVRASTDYGETIQTFLLSVLSDSEGPVFTSSPTTRATIGQTYRYTPAAQAGSQALPVTIQTAPTGMSIDGATGELTWVPASGGSFQVVLVANSSKGAARQEFVVVVPSAAGNKPPVLDPISLSQAFVGQSFTLDLNARDPEGTAVRYFATAMPADASINPLNGVLSWTPPASFENRDVTLRLGAQDQSGLKAYLDVTVHVNPGAFAGNRPPRITSIPIYYAAVGASYTYRFEAEDPDFDQVELRSAQLPDGSSFDLATGLFTWTPSQEGPAAVVFKAVDVFGAAASQGFLIVVEPSEVNRAPIITSTPPNQGVAYRAFEYQVEAFDLENDPLEFALLSAPAGMRMDLVTGNLTWLPTAGGEYSVELLVRDGFGDVTTQSFEIEVWADDVAPLITVSASPRYPKVGESTQIHVDVQDTSPISAVEVLLDGQLVTLDAAGNFTAVFTSAGRHDVLVRAGDVAGNFGEEAFLIGVRPPGLRSFPSSPFTTWSTMRSSPCRKL